MNKKAEQEEWLKTLQNKMHDYKEPVDNSAWQQLEHRLNAVQTRNTMKSHRYYYATAAAVAVLIGFAVFFNMLYSPSNVTTVPKELARNVIKQQDNSNNNDLASAATMQTRTEPQQRTNNSKITSTVNVPITNVYKPAVQEKETIASEIDKTANEEQTAPDMVTTNSTNKGEDKQETKSNETHQKKKRSLPIMANADIQSQHKQKASWSIGLSVGGGAIQNTNKNEAMAGYCDVMYDESNIASVALLKVANYNYTKNSFNHHQPISFGINIRKNLDKQFSLETGLTYTMLISDVNDGEKKQRLYYIGIPLKGNWTFLHREPFEMYLSAGGMVEKCIYARLAGQNLKLNKLQFSVNTGLGAAYLLSKHLSIYGEAGVAYYFDDGSFVQSIRKKAPFNLNLQAGLR